MGKSKYPVKQSPLIDVMVLEYMNAMGLALMMLLRLELLKRYYEERKRAEQG